MFLFYDFRLYIESTVIVTLFPHCLQLVVKPSKFLWEYTSLNIIQVEDGM